MLMTLARLAPFFWGCRQVDFGHVSRFSVDVFLFSFCPLRRAWLGKIQPLPLQTCASFFFEGKSHISLCSLPPLPSSSPWLVALLGLCYCWIVDYFGGCSSSQNPSLRCYCMRFFVRARRAAYQIKKHPVLRGDLIFAAFLAMKIKIPIPLFGISGVYVRAARRGRFEGTEWRRRNPIPYKEQEALVTLGAPLSTHADLTACVPLCTLCKNSVHPSVVRKKFMRLKESTSSECSGVVCRAT